MKFSKEQLKEAMKEGFMKGITFYRKDEQRKYVQKNMGIEAERPLFDIDKEFEEWFNKQHVSELP